MSRALDALVAEQVMGWTPTEYWCDNQPVRGLVPPDGGLRDVNRYPQYSSDLAAAWEVVERLVSGDEYDDVEIGWGYNQARVTFRLRGYRPFLDREGEAVAATVPEAICLAALKALHIPLPETV